MLRLDKVSVSYKDTLALKNITIHIQEGQKVALIGPSGAGKTTLLYTLYELEKQHASFVYQDYALVPQLSVFHNVYMGRLDHYHTAYNLFNLLKPQKKEIEKVAPILDSLGMLDTMFKRVGALSGGQQQRAAIARAMFRKVETMFADEPVSSIDPHQAGTVLRLITHATKTVIFSLHSVDLALQFAERIIGMRLGQILFDLPSDQVNDHVLSQLYKPC
ncbi:MAG: ATP-binding cassette domain-containing protein [SAR324 cluster bacterium]|nr:ATP-binding cassette domain-containing protein [SAR324 cluster bacterium]